MIWRRYITVMLVKLLDFQQITYGPALIKLTEVINKNDSRNRLISAEYFLVITYTMVTLAGWTGEPIRAIAT